MKKFSLRMVVFLLLIAISACQSQSNKNTATQNKTDSPEGVEVVSDTEEIVENPKQTNTKPSKLDSAAIITEIENLSTIEQFAVFNPFSKKYDFDLYANLLNYKKQEKKFQELSTQISEQRGHFNTSEFIKVDSKNGYIQYAQAESDVTIVYWNKSDGTKLIAHEITGCGPICESSIRFSLYKKGVLTLLEEIDYRGIRKFENGEFKKYKRFSTEVKSQIIPRARDLPYMLVPGYDETDLDPIEFSFVLPQKGKNIQFCLEDICIELVWNDGVFAVAK